MHNQIGYNYGMPNINASLGLSQISKINDILNKKRNIHSHYKKLFLNCNKIEFLSSNDNSKPNCWLNTISVKTKNYFEFKKKILSLIKKGIDVRPLWLPCHLQVFLNKFERFKIYNANKLYKEIVCIPSSYFLKKKRPSINIKANYQ